MVAHDFEGSHVKLSRATSSQSRARPTTSDSGDGLGLSNEYEKYDARGGEPSDAQFIGVAAAS